MIAVYATLQDANWALKNRRSEDFPEYSDDDNPEDLENGTDANGCAYFSMTDQEGNGHELRVEWKQVEPAGSVPKPPPSQDGAASEEDEEDEDDEDEDDEQDDAEQDDDDIHEHIKQEQAKGGRKIKCGGEGCGAPLCSDCWPQTEEEWEGFF